MKNDMVAYKTYNLSYNMTW